MIVFIRQPFIVQNYPIVNWDSVVPKRGKQLHVRVDLDFLHEGEDSEKINALMNAVQELMEDATFRDTGNKVLPAKLAQLVTQDGRETVVPAGSIPRGMLIGKEQEDGQRQQKNAVRQEEPRPHILEVKIKPDIPIKRLHATFTVGEDSLRDEGREVGGEATKGDTDPRDPSDA